MNLYLNARTFVVDTEKKSEFDVLFEFPVGAKRLRGIRLVFEIVKKYVGGSIFLPYDIFKSFFIARKSAPPLVLEFSNQYPSFHSLTLLFFKIVRRDVSFKPSVSPTYQIIFNRSMASLGKRVSSIREQKYKFCRNDNVIYDYFEYRLSPRLGSLSSDNAHLATVSTISIDCRIIDRRVGLLRNDIVDLSKNVFNVRLDNFDINRHCVLLQSIICLLESRTRTISIRYHSRTGFNFEKLAKWIVLNTSMKRIHLVQMNEMYAKLFFPILLDNDTLLDFKVYDLRPSEKQNVCRFNKYLSSQLFCETCKSFYSLHIPAYVFLEIVASFVYSSFLEGIVTFNCDKEKEETLHRLQIKLHRFVIHRIEKVYNSCKRIKE